MLRQIEWEVQNGPIRKNEILPVTTLFFLLYFSLRPSNFWLLWPTFYFWIEEWVLSSAPAQS